MLAGGQALVRAARRSVLSRAGLDVVADVSDASRAAKAAELYGAALVAIMVLRPQGLIPNVRRMRELKEEEVAQDAWGRRGAGGESVSATIQVGGAGAATPERIE